ncbi:MAG: HD domain-containing protein [Acidimicrobiia bacterium]
MATSDSTSKSTAAAGESATESAAVTVTQLTSRYTDALEMARIVHADQVRKGTPIPYLTHLMDVSSAVLEYGGTEDQAIAGLLHDAAEDGGGEARLAAIRAEFGDGVADIVADLSDSLTEDRTNKAPWLERKSAYLAHLLDASEASLLVCSADKLDNVLAMRLDHRKVGAALWNRFNSEPKREGQLWYHLVIAETFEDRLRSGRAAELARELRYQVDQLWEDVIRVESVSRAELEGELGGFRASVAAASNH